MFKRTLEVETELAKMFRRTPEVKNVELELNLEICSDEFLELRTELGEMRI